MRARVMILLGAMVLLLAGVGVAVASVSAGSRSGPLYATMSVSTHYPNCKQLWPVKVTATWDGHPAHASAKYQFFYGANFSTPVGTQYPFGETWRNPHNHWWVFRGSFYDNTFGPFGALAVGHKIYVRVVVVDGRQAAIPQTWVVVQKATGCPARR